MTNEIRKTGIIYNGMYNQIKEIEKGNKELAGELAIAYFERILAGEIESDNPIVKALIAPVEPIIEKDIKGYNEKLDGQEAQQKDKLRETYRLYKQGKTQVEIAKELGLKQSTISKRMKIIKRDFPELMSEIDAESFSF